MLVLNTTFSGALSDRDELIAFLQERYIPTTLAHGTLHSPLVYEVLGTQSDGDTFSLALQFSFDGLEQLERYQQEHFPMVQEMLVSEFGQRVVGFMTLMRQL